MLVAQIRTKEPWNGVIKKCDSLPVLLFDPSLVESYEELSLAYALAQKSFEAKENIAQQFKYEVLLWLTGKRDIKNALKVSLPRGREALLMIFDDEKKKILESPGVEEIALHLKKEADPLRLERISLSRIL